jgi:molybdopterin-guanine dinucleotide biosynthesis protein A
VKISVLLLAGGRSRRLGIDKRFLEFKEKPLILRAFETSKTISDDVHVLFSDIEDEEPLRRILGAEPRFLIDSKPGSGPMGSLIGGLAVVKHEYALLLGIDFPLMESSFLSKLSQKLQATVPLPKALVPISSIHAQVTCALYHSSLREPLKADFDDGERSIWDWLKRHESLVQYVQESEWGIWANSNIFTNINTPEDLARLQQLD